MTWTTLHEQQVGLHLVRAEIRNEAIDDSGKWHHRVAVLFDTDETQTVYYDQPIRGERLREDAEELVKAAFDYRCLKVEQEQLLRGAIDLPLADTILRLVEIWDEGGEYADATGDAWDWAAEILGDIKQICQQEVGDGD